MKKKQRVDRVARDAAASDMSQVVSIDVLKALPRIHRILSDIRRLEGAQSGLNGNSSTAKNLWIVKPAAKSRGRGIATFSDLNKLLKYVEAGVGSSSSSQWIVQKYMENPLILAKRKFDFRQWVLVTDWNPLTVYFYHKCYARFSVEEYSTEENDLENAYVHLVNNSIGKNSSNFTKTVVAENGAELEGYMLDFESVSECLRHVAGRDVMPSIQQRMKVTASEIEFYEFYFVFV
jgi:hypothetical protein